MENKKTKTLSTKFGNAIIEESINRDFKNLHMRKELIALLQALTKQPQETNVYKLIKPIMTTAQEKPLISESDYNDIYSDKLQLKKAVAVADTTKNDATSKWIMEQLKSGLTEQQIKEILLNSGWKTEHINQYFKINRYSNKINPLTPPPPPL